MKMQDGTFALADYGEGINLNYMHQQNPGRLQYHIGVFEPAGTPYFMAPYVRKQWRHMVENNHHKNRKLKFDLYKADIFSLGITFY